MILGNVKFHWKYTFVSIRDTCLLLLFSVFFLVCSNQVVVQFCRKIFSSVQLKIYGHNSRWKSERIIFFCCCKKRVTINLPNTRHKIVMSCVFFFFLSFSSSFKSTYITRQIIESAIRRPGTMWLALFGNSKYVRVNSYASNLEMVREKKSWMFCEHYSGTIIGIVMPIDDWKVDREKLNSVNDSQFLSITMQFDQQWKFSLKTRFPNEIETCYR